MTPRRAVGAVASIHEAIEALDRNANEALLLQAIAAAALAAGLAAAGNPGAAPGRSG